MDTLFVGKILHHYEEVSSTNELAAEALKKGLVAEGTVFQTNHQTGGKGQRGRNWDDTPGQNFLASFVLHPKFLRTQEQFYLVMATSLAVKEALDNHLSTKCTIKWPNDIYVNDKKIAGILIESSMKGANMNSSIVGIGVNINQSQFPPTILATSLLLETGNPYAVSAFMEEVSKYLEVRYMQLKRDLSGVREDYLQAMYKRGEIMSFQVGLEVQDLTIVGVDEIGQLCVKSEDHEERCYGLHQIRMLLPTTER